MSPFDTYVTSLHPVKDKPFWILLKQEMMGWQWHQLNHMQIICTSLQTDSYASTSSLHIFYRMLFLPPSQQRQSTEDISQGTETYFQWKTNRKSYVAYRMALVLVTLNDVEGHSRVAGLFKCNPSNICAVFYQISADSALMRSLSDSWASCRSSVTILPRYLKLVTLFDAS